MTLGDRQAQFSSMLAVFLPWLRAWCQERGMRFRVQHLPCTATHHSSRSLHPLALAADIMLDRYDHGSGRWVWLTDSEEHREPAEKWVALGGAAGYYFDLDGDGLRGDDGNHYSLEWEGRR